MKDDAATYYAKLADAKVHGEGMDQIYKWLVVYYADKKDEANMTKYIGLGKQVYPADGFWESYELDYLREKMLPGINLHVRTKLSKKDAIDVKLFEPVPLGAVLQYLEDELAIIFVLRDYGIVVVSADERIPPGAVRVIDFWKHGKTAEPALREGQRQKDPNVTPVSPEKKSTRGAIERVDPNDPSLVQISLGSDAGVAKGRTLDVFRLAPQPRFLGHVRIVEVYATRSVGKATFFDNFDTLALPQVGDHVALKAK